MSKNKKRNLSSTTAYKIIEDAVREYWKKSFPQDVVAFFFQKYEYEDTWEWCEELVEAYSSTNYEDMIFLNDFCEGQTCVKDLVVVPFDEVTRFYSHHMLDVLKSGQ